MARTTTAALFGLVMLCALLVACTGSSTNGTVEDGTANVGSSDSVVESFDQTLDATDSESDPTADLDSLDQDLADLG